MHFLATCTPGAERIVRNELSRQNIDITYGQDRLIGFQGDMMTMIRANLWSRAANRIYIELDKLSVTSFDGLFASIEAIDWSYWIAPGTAVRVNATSARSVLAHTPTIQSVAHKALIRRLSRGTDEWHEDAFLPPVEIFVLIVADEAHILIDTTGPALHKRGYRLETGEAPIKESLAAILVIQSGWKYREPLYDPLCGSGTILIEAAMIARNVAPGLLRKFDYQHFRHVDQELYESAVVEARSRIFHTAYPIYGSDTDPEMIQIARANARAAGVDDTIEFTVSDMRDRDYLSGGYIVTNPPYGKRIGSDDLGGLYDDLSQIFTKNDMHGGVITLYPDFPLDPTGWTKTNLMNGAEKCQFWKRDQVSKTK